MERYDAIIIGAGVNSLTAAAYLARAGLRTLVLEKNARPGGIAASREIEPGFTCSTSTAALGTLRPEIVRDLELARHGLQLLPHEGALTLAGGGQYLAASADANIMHRELARLSERDADAARRFARDMAAQVECLRPVLMQTPPNPASFSRKDRRGISALLARFQALGAPAMADAIRVWTLSAADLLDRYFENDVVKARFGAPAVIGTGLGPMSPGSAYVLLHNQPGRSCHVRGGMGAIAAALVRALDAQGGALRTEAPVAEIRMEKNRATGVILEDGTQIAGRLVVSGLDLKHSMLSLLEANTLPRPLMEQVCRFKTRGSSALLDITLNGLPEFSAVPEDCPALDGSIRICGTLTDMERAYDDWKERVLPRRPVVELSIPSRLDPTLAPPGKHIASVFVQYVPDELLDGPWTSAKRDSFRDTVLEMIEAEAPGFRKLIRKVETRTPDLLEEETGLTHGNIFQGELTLDQLAFNRPLPGMAQYRTPVKGYYLCGASTHPGGVMGASGANAAREVLADMGRRP